jgi:23S rRNA U2552 (ribose-2'-O)-methylase RlmE/FtsJ
MQTLQEIYKKYCTNSPKNGGDKGTIHSYIDEYYSSALLPYRSSSNKILEIGINNGHSLLMWEEYFPHAEIIGIDLRIPDISTNCRLVKGDATDPKTFADIDNLDVVIDDGSHILEHQLKSFDILFPKLNPNGIYIIEDIKDIDSTKERFLSLYHNVQIFDMRSIKNRDDDVIVQIKK